MTATEVKANLRNWSANQAGQPDGVVATARIRHVMIQAVELLERGAPAVESEFLGLKLSKNGDNYVIEPLVTPEEGEKLRAETQRKSERFEMERFLREFNGPARFLDLKAMDDGELYRHYQGTVAFGQQLETAASFEEGRLQPTHPAETATDGTPFSEETVAAAQEFLDHQGSENAEDTGTEEGDPPR